MPPLDAERFSLGSARRLTARADLPDVRDFLYQPALTPLRPELDPRSGDDAWWVASRVRDQGDAPNCTAQALAGIVDHMRARELFGLSRKERATTDRPWASARMLYQIAQAHDEFPGENNIGSSIRGTLKAFFYNGACARDAVGDLPRGGWHMTRAILKSARKVQLGAYYRVQPRLADVHAALGEAGLILAAADIHAGWDAPSGVIPYAGTEQAQGRHAFIILGYNDRGFLIQNSWGPDWGEQGVALWSYADWSANVVDMWVLRLAVHTNGAATVARAQSDQKPLVRRLGRGFEAQQPYPFQPPSRFDVIGHVASLSRGKLDRHGPYHIDLNTLMETVRVLEASTHYDHVLVHFMGLQRHEAATMAALRDAIPVFQRNRIYPFFVTVENALSGAVHDMVDANVARVNSIAGPLASPDKDRYIAARLTGAPLRMVDEIRRASMAVVYEQNEDQAGEGLELLQYLFQRLESRHRGAGGFGYHFSAHGFGNLVLARLFERSESWNSDPVISTVSMLSPMVGVDVLDRVFDPFVADRRDRPVHRRGRGDAPIIEDLEIFTQTKDAFSGDHPMQGYGGNWPRLWSDVFSAAKGRTGWESSGDLLALQHLPTTLGRGKFRITPMEARHRDFDLTPGVLDALLNRIAAGGRAKLRPELALFSDAFRGRDSLLSEHVPVLPPVAMV